MATHCHSFWAHLQNQHCYAASVNVIQSGFGTPVFLSVPLYGPWY